MADTGIFAWLSRASICGDRDVERAAKIMQDYYQGVGPEPEYEEVRRTSSLVREGEMPELPPLPKPHRREEGIGGYTDLFTAEQYREGQRQAYAHGRGAAVRDYVNLSDATTKAAAPADAPELVTLRKRVAHLEAMLDARLERKPDDSQEWAKVDGAIAFHLIERHADDWNDAGRMMDAWRDANPRRATSVPAIPGTGWIETSKQKPEPGQWCVVNIRTHYVNAPPRDSVSAARYDGCNWCADGHHLYEPTHWMPFPAAPSHPSEAKAGEDA